MNQAFDARLDLDKRAEIHESRDGAAHSLARGVFSGNGIPRMRLHLLHADGNAMLIGIDLDDLRLNLLAHGEHVRRFVNAMPGNFADVKQRVRSADLDKRPVVGEAANHALHRIAFFKLRKTALLAGPFFVFGNGAAIDHHVFVIHIDLGDAAADLLLDQLLHFGGVFCSGAGGGHEGAHTDIHAQSPLDYAGHGADDDRLLGKSLFERRPIGGALDLAAGQFVVAFGVAPLDGDLNLVAGLWWLVGRKRRERQHALGLVSDIEHDGVGSQGNHRAFAALCARLPLAGMALLVFGKNVFERFDRKRFGWRWLNRRAGWRGWVEGGQLGYGRLGRTRFRHARLGHVWVGRFWIGHEEEKPLAVRSRIG